MNKHTPGPWESFLFKDDCFVVAPCNAPQDVICNLLTDSKEYPELKALDFKTQEANARLIVNAPEMYEALRNIVLNSFKIFSASAGVWNFINDARTLLARIDGEQEEKS